MNAVMTIRSLAQPLPAVLDTPLAFNLLHRRRNIGDYRPTSFDLSRFNDLLARLGRPQGPVDVDQLATAARQLSAGEDEEAPGCIAQRIAWIESVAAMAADRAWAAAHEVVECARLVVEYARDSQDLIPDWMPRIGRLDDAIVVEAAWPTLGREAAGYRDFVRLRALEARLRGCEPEAMPFDRSAWQAARLQEAALAAHRRRVREGTYVPAPPAMFRVH